MTNADPTIRHVTFLQYANPAQVEFQDVLYHRDPPGNIAFAIRTPGPDADRAWDIFWFDRNTQDQSGEHVSYQRRHGAPRAYEPVRCARCTRVIESRTELLAGGDRIRVIAGERDPINVVGDEWLCKECYEKAS